MTRSTGRIVLALATAGSLLTSGRASAQSDKTEVEIAPLYLWAARISGHIAADNKGIPVFMDFKDAAKNLAGAFAVHGEVRRGRWGALGDINFVRLSTDTAFTVTAASLPVTGTAQIDTVIFEAGVSYLVAPKANVNLIGGVRTYSLSPDLHFTTTSGGTQLADVSASRTVAAAFGGFTYRPKLSEKVTFISRADLGGGQAFSWNALLGVEYQSRPLLGLTIGYRGLGMDTGSVPKNGTLVRDVEYDITQYGPFFSLTFHWKQK